MRIPSAPRNTRQWLTNFTLDRCLLMRIKAWSPRQIAMVVLDPVFATCYRLVVPTKPGNNPSWAFSGIVTGVTKLLSYVTISPGVCDIRPKMRSS
ncbi:uncharacterized protein BDZ83DRAFT_412410 [Colletotrichum acutatum]|uniref:Uncharacterized protein n=1 Tax=Glomerella acutata TaxID=27357 RepID=A0AAD8XGR6_GLOAC|nr:uncharacterized protein BDZ83DRAFT_412410 [Colletotrichum acutatum]KAK1722775.1 hypothetical protein BDZ83DRAFT_412410 [Colletotrichum acutatum]